MDSFLPSRKQQYLLQNYQQSSEYRPYHEHIPSYLHNRPRSIIIHCLDRKTNSSKILATDINDVDTDQGIFEIVKLSGKKHTVDFGSVGELSCTCKDWIRHQLPKEYLQSDYLSSDSSAIGENIFIHLLKLNPQIYLQQLMTVPLHQKSREW